MKKSPFCLNLTVHTWWKHFRGAQLWLYDLWPHISNPVHCMASNVSSAIQFWSTSQLYSVIRHYDLCSTWLYDCTAPNQVLIPRLHSTVYSMTDPKYLIYFHFLQCGNSATDIGACHSNRTLDDNLDLKVTGYSVNFVSRDLDKWRRCRDLHHAVCITRVGHGCDPKLPTPSGCLLHSSVDGIYLLKRRALATAGNDAQADELKVAEFASTDSDSSPNALICCHITSPEQKLYPTSAIRGISWAEANMISPL